MPAYASNLVRNRFFRLVGVALTLSLAVLAMPGAAQIGSPGYRFLEAVRDRDGDAAMELLNQSNTLINTREVTTGQTALLVVVERRDLVWMRFLLQRGADANIADRNGLTPLIRATQLGLVDGAEVLIRGGARVNDGGTSGETPLHLAVQRRDAAMVRLLIASGANADQTDNITGLSPRDLAVRDGRAAAILALLDARPAASTTPPVAGPN